MTKSPNVTRALRFLVAVIAAAVVALGWSSTASAHTEFETSTPEDGATVDGPLSTVTVEFTNPAVESGTGFELLEPGGTVRTPESLDPTDGTSFIATFDPPLTAGSYGFRWAVQAGDAHPIDGSFQFTVVGGTATTSAVNTTVPAATTPAATTPAATTPAATTPATASSATAPASDASSSTATAAAVASSATTVPTSEAAIGMEEFIEGDATPNPLAGQIARAIIMGSTVFATGIIAALLWVVRGRRDEIARLLVWVRLAGLGLITGGLAAFAALDETQSTTRTALAGSKPGIATLLSIAGGVLIFFGFRHDGGSVVGPPRSLSAATAITTPRSRPMRSATDQHSDRFRWVLDASSAPGVAGIALVLVAYWFDGHTVSRGPWALHAATNLVHVAAASVWVGGVFAMTLVAWMRKRRSTATGLAEMVVRFSSIAGICLAALSVAGVAMAWLINGSLSGLLSTPWGQVLAVKIGAVAIAAGLGAYNHFVLRPKLSAHDDDPEVAAHLRTSLTLESITMLMVIVITAVLVASAN